MWSCDKIGAQTLIQVTTTSWEWRPTRSRMTFRWTGKFLRMRASCKALQQQAWMLYFSRAPECVLVVAHMPWKQGSAIIKTGRTLFVTQLLPQPTSPLHYAPFCSTRVFLALCHKTAALDTKQGGLGHQLVLWGLQRGSAVHSKAMQCLAQGREGISPTTCYGYPLPTTGHRYPLWQTCPVLLRATRSNLFVICWLVIPVSQYMPRVAKLLILRATHSQKPQNEWSWGHHVQDSHCLGTTRHISGNWCFSYMRGHGVSHLYTAWEPRVAWEPQFGYPWMSNRQPASQI